MLINKFLPKFQFSEKHQIKIEAPANVVMNQIINFNPEMDKATKVLMTIRELPIKMMALFNPQENKESFGFHSFVLLDKQDNEEMTLGLIGKFWRPNFGLEQFSTAEEFQTFSQIGVAKLVMNFSIQELDSHLCILSTETRVFCPDKKTVLLFSPYWYLIRLASGFIRRRMLSQIKVLSISY